MAQPPLLPTEHLTWTGLMPPPTRLSNWPSAEDWDGSSFPGTTDLHQVTGGEQRSSEANVALEPVELAINILGCG